MRNYISLSPDPDRNQALAELSTILALSKSAVLAIISGAQKQPSSRIQ